MSTKSVLIASSSLDAPTWEPVAVDLANRGYNVIAYEADKVARGETAISIQISADNGVNIQYNGCQLQPEAMNAAWYRRSTLISNAIEKDRAKQLGLDSERKVLQSAIWDAVPAKAWLNSPDAIRHAEKKLTQLVLARELGFSIPETVIGNDWETIRNALPREIVFKTSYPLILFCNNDDLRSLYTTTLENPSALPVGGNPFPGIWQTRIQKAREWRITVVGDETFDAAIHTSPDANDDWRKHYDIPGSVEFVSESFPDEPKAMCFRFLGRLGLRFGAFDFIEKPDGEIVFLECNPNGQFGWLEDILGFPISGAIANELAAIANRT